jgi:hypothetical protein
MGAVLGLLAFGTVFGSWAVYWPKIKAMRVPLHPLGHQAVIVLGLILAMVSFTQGPGLLGGIGAALAFLAGGLFLFFTLMSGMPEKAPAVAVGQSFLDFTAKDADGNDFTLSSLKGTPFLLKFFRGHW